VSVRQRPDAYALTARPRATWAATTDEQTGEPWLFASLRGDAIAGLTLWAVLVPSYSTIGEAVDALR
jgi:hypothetical protein